MITLNCVGCANNCCKNPSLTPVLTPSEESKFDFCSLTLETPYRVMHLMKKNQDSTCVFLSDDMRCQIYSQRPLECKLYPFLLDFDDNGANVKIDERFCPHLKNLNFDYKRTLSFVSKHHFPQDWIQGYLFLNNV